MRAWKHRQDCGKQMHQTRYFIERDSSGQLPCPTLMPPRANSSCEANNSVLARAPIPTCSGYNRPRGQYSRTFPNVSVPPLEYVIGCHTRTVTYHDKVSRQNFVAVSRGHRHARHLPSDTLEASELGVPHKCRALAWRNEYAHVRTRCDSQRTTAWL